MKYVIVDPCVVIKANGTWNKFSSTFRNNSLFSTKNDTLQQKEIFAKMKLDLIATEYSENGKFTVVSNDDSVKVLGSEKYVVVSGKVAVVRPNLALMMRLKKMPKGAGVVVDIPDNARIFIDPENSAIKVVDASKEDKVTMYSIK